MRLLNKKSIINCNNEEDQTQHEIEINAFFAKISELPDYECALLRKYQDKYHANIPQKVIPTTLHQLADDLQGEDLKNGIDIVVDGEYFIIVAYGSGYQASNGEYGLDTLALKILPYDEERSFLNITNNVINGAAVVVAKNQFEKEKRLFS